MRALLLLAVIFSACFPALAQTDLPCPLGNICVLGVILVGPAPATPSAPVSMSGDITVFGTATSASVSTGLNVPINVPILSWIAPSAPVSGYNIYRSTILGGPFTQINSFLLTDMSYIDTAVLPGQTYYYTVTYIDLGGTESNFSNEIVMTVPALLSKNAYKRKIMAQVHPKDKVTTDHMGVVTYNTETQGQLVLGNLSVEVLRDLARNESASREWRKAAVELLLEKGHPHANHPELRELVFQIKAEQAAKIEVEALAAEAQDEAPFANDQTAEALVDEFVEQPKARAELVKEEQAAENEGLAVRPENEQPIPIEEHPFFKQEVYDTGGSLEVTKEE